jgi:hypothetical protein
MVYNPQEGSVAFKVIEFLTTHPDEELTTEDVSAKYDKPRKNVHSLLGTAVESGALTRSENEDGELVYRLGKGTPLVKANPHGAPSLRAAIQGAWGGVKPAANPRRRPPVALDLDAITIDKDVPFVVRSAGKSIDYPGLFNRMGPGHSCLLPITTKASLGKACTEFKKAGHGLMAISLIDDDSLRLFRLK